MRFASMGLKVAKELFFEIPIWAASSRNKTNKMTCAPSEDSDQPVHPPSLIRVFAVRMKKACVHWAHTEDSDQTGRMPRLIWVFAGRTCQSVVLSRSSSSHLWCYAVIDCLGVLAVWLPYCCWLHTGEKSYETYKDLRMVLFAFDCPI